MATLEQAAAALMVRPLLWQVLNEFQQTVLRARMRDQAYTAIAETIGDRPVSTDLIKRAEVNAIQQVVVAQRKAVTMDRLGFAKRYTTDRWVKRYART